jgi:hypothetical protein
LAEIVKTGIRKSDARSTRESASDEATEKV